MFQQVIMYILLSVEKNWRQKLKITLRMVFHVAAENWYVSTVAKNVKHHTFAIKLLRDKQLLPWRKVSFSKTIEVWAVQQ